MQRKTNTNNPNQILGGDQIIFVYVQCGWKYHANQQNFVDAWCNFGNSHINFVSPGVFVFYGSTNQITKYKYKSNIRFYALLNKYKQIKPNQILIFLFKSKSNSGILIQGQIKFQSALLFGCIWFIWLLHWLWAGKWMALYARSSDNRVHACNLS